MADVDIEIVTEIKGLDELEEAFTAGGVRAVKKFLRRVEMQAAGLLKESAERYAPELTGALADDIHRQTVQGDGTLTVRVGPSKETFYGLIQEFGAPEKNIIGTPWLEQSAKAVQTDVLEEYYEGLREGLEDMKK